MDERGFLTLLTREGHVSAEAAERAARASAQTGTPIERTLLEFGLLPEDDLFGALARHVGLPFVSSAEFDSDHARALSLSPEFLARAEVMPVRDVGGRLLVATSDPRGAETVQSIGFHLDRPVDMAIAPPSSIKAALHGLEAEENAPQADVAETDLERLRQMANDGPVIKLVADIVARAVGEGASDIHVEAGERAALIRFRIDGVLHTRQTVPDSQRAALVSRLKVMSGLNISEKRRPQDGRARMAVRGREIDIRLSTLPTQFGESVVLRLLDRSRVALSWDALGFPAARAAEIAGMVAEPNGIFLVAGPTGSGKTTTLYTALSGLNSDDRKILTVEDPIEFSLPGVNQVQVEPAIDMTFANALRAILRQDPDVIMVGEIRDEETAEIAVRAALVGRMVLSTIHTNDSIAAIPRLMDLGVPAYLLAATLRGVLSQRLVRTTCTACNGSGCATCGETGRSGRTVVSELLRVSSGFAGVIEDAVDPATLARAAAREGFVSMTDAAQVLVSDGRVDRQDALRALGGSTDF
ncbi:GspE/PulE family protein [Pseudaestuariivita atlantica]|uniref:Bacterial type II secretion system protein E domain-containing protein n=1 Tax=Pseudaestuariivita atlantica TaxID=1317121 RepID=A0A0L1JPX4_9RHOB|nr:GspE/PulE family protein [Pseudaestuariivita atlantica]KNG93791.1 hypothetical protein ATO11_11495 [Pseudaestuariivita atlantica]